MIVTILIAAVLLCGTAPALAMEPPPDTRDGSMPAPSDTDSDDNAEDQDEKKGKKDGYRILPIPIFITEPAIGEGLGVALTIFHPGKQGNTGSKPKAATPKSIGDATKRGKAPPVVSALFGAYTSNGTWAGGIAHSNNFRGDTIRYAGAVAVADLTSDFYVLGSAIEFELEGGLVYQALQFRAGQSRFLFGTTLSYLDATNTFDLGAAPSIPPEFLTSDIRQVGVAAKATYEGRDNATMPSRGQFVELNLWRYDEAIGSDFNYWNPTLRFLSFHQLGTRFNIDLRLDVAAVDGRPPFFGFPWVKLRGIPAMRYQDEKVGALELQGRFKAAERWIVLGFTGIGATGEDLAFTDNSEAINTYGAGTRFNIFEDQKIWVGLDIARGPEDWAWYIQVNHPW